jgi:hypothetical protein
MLAGRLIMPFLDPLTGSWLGSLLGMRHALEADHLAAVTTLVSRERSGYRAALLGLYWGLGHTGALVLAGVVLVLLRAEMPEGAAAGFELLVALMLVALGLRAISQAARQGSEGPARVHRHGRRVHAHAGVPAHVHIGTWTLARRPLAIGAVHGLAGSGALTALVLTTLPSASAQLAYVVLFGLGSTVGMAALSGLLGWPLARLGAHHAFTRGISVLVGCISIAIGVWWGLPVIGRLL